MSRILTILFDFDGVTTNTEPRMIFSIILKTLSGPDIICHCR